MIVQVFFRFVVAFSSLLLICAIPAQTADEPLDLTSMSDTDLKTLTVRMERTACYGTCPAYTVIIHGDGRVEYNGKRYVKEEGAREGRIGADSIKALANEFAKAKFFALSEDYSGENCKRYCTDFPIAVTEISVRNRSHRVKHDYGCGDVPKSILDLESSIEKVADVKRWTGDVSKSGPVGTACMNRP